MDFDLLPRAGSPPGRGGGDLLVVDAAVAGAAILLDGRRAGVEVFHLAPGGNALAQIAGHLAGRRDVAALHVLAHGEPGAILLAGERIDAASLAAGADGLAAIATALAATAMVTLYGCSVAAGAAGIGFLDALETALGVEVAASSGPVGALALGGGWTLRGRDGTAVEPVFTATARAVYPGLLSTFTLDGTNNAFTGGAGNDSFSVLGANHLHLGDLLDGGDGFDTLVISATLTITLDATTLLNFELVTITAGVQVIISDDATIAVGQTLTIDASGSPDAVNLNFSAETDGSLTYIGGGGADTVTSGAGNDTLSGGAGADRLSGMAGNDVIYGGAADDVLVGGSGNDGLYGGDGADTLSGGTGNDVMSGGAGSDTFTGSSGDHNNDTISDFAVGDTIVVTGTDLTSTINGTTAAGTLSLGGGSVLTLTGITASSGTFSATFGGGNTSIILVAPSSGGSGTGSSSDLAVSDTGGDSSGGSRTITNTGSEPASAAVVQNTGNNGNVVTATLPASVSITSDGPSAAQSGSTAADTLVDAIDDLDAPGEGGAIGATEGFLNSLAATTPLDVRTIVPTTFPGISTDDPIVFTGGGGDSQAEALVIDMRTIAGKTLQVDNIGFVSIVGPAHVTGGAGDNYAVGDDNAQFMSLGAGDDTLYGGGGSDTIGSAGGSDRLFGDAGSDTVSGGAEADMAYGNLDADVVYGNQGSDTLFGGQNDDTLYGGQDDDVMHGNLGDDALYGGQGADLFVVAGSGGNDTVADFDGTGGDRVQIAANPNGTAIDSFGELQAAATDTAGGGVLIVLGAGNSLELMGVSTGELQSGWFVFA